MEGKLTPEQYESMFGKSPYDHKAPPEPRSGRRAVHTCHATNCNQRVPPKMFMCLKHWRMIPPQMQSRIWAAYRPGQEVDKRPSEEYVKVTNEAIKFVRERELSR